MIEVRAKLQKKLQKGYTAQEITFLEIKNT